MEDKVLWIALKLFMVWLFVMAFCLCICNCLFIRSDRQKSKEAKSAAARAVLERHKRLNRQCCECAEDEKLVGVGVGNLGGKGNSHGHLKTHLPNSLSDTEYQLTGQVSSGLAAHSAYIQRAATPRFTVQHPSVDDVNLSHVTQHSSIDIDIDVDVGRETLDPVRKNPGRLSSELLLSLLRTPSGKYLLFGKEERFPRIETASNPALNVEKFPAPSRKPYVPKKRFPQQADFTLLDKDRNGIGGSSQSNSNSSMALPQTPSFVITEVEGLERPRSSSFSGQNSSRHPSPYRTRLTPSPSPTPSSLGSQGSDQNQHSPLLPRHPSPSSCEDRDERGSGQVTIDIPLDVQPQPQLPRERENQEDPVNPSIRNNTNGFNSNISSSSSSPDPDSQPTVRRSIVSDV